MARFCELCSESSGSMKEGKFIGQLSDAQVLKEKAALNNDNKNTCAVNVLSKYIIKQSIDLHRSI